MDQRIVRCKFKVDEIRETSSGKTVDGIYVKCSQYTVVASPVYANGDPNHENTKFWEASPSGAFTITTNNPAVLDVYKVGEEFFLESTPVK